ncbi:MAG TPA: DUF3558 domain-containing protein [Amycolatopsis sp.]|uniref:DUF3558 domain-containing protein n=1 Tax=Amycolatopsis sp. TaxID=37632 RepID=UPI002B494C05|nr:DUF3558 domain-containing protein [Amycolatopsis sp.]HKS44085.1 DUF3558 domain-containing protein [Amycolatopsis sp.]
MRRYRSAFAVATLAVTLVASCTADKTGDARPTGSTTSAPQPSTESAAPGVATPLTTDRYEQSPCDGLTQDQIDRFLGTGVSPEPDLNAPGGPACNWHTSDGSGASIGIGFVAKGLSRIYGGKGSAFAFFQPLGTIQGYPAVAYGVNDDRMTSGSCTVAVGTSDNSTIDVGATIRRQNIGKKDPCDAAYQVAQTIIDNIKRGS